MTTPRPWLLALTALLTLAAPVAASAQSEIPRFDPAAGCGSAPLLDAESGRKKGDCLRDEQDARGRLTEQWTQFPVASRRACTGEVKSGGPPSYVELLTCLELMREAAQEEKTVGAGRR